MSITAPSRVRLSEITTPITTTTRQRFTECGSEIGNPLAAYQYTFDSFTALTAIRHLIDLRYEIASGCKCRGKDPSYTNSCPNVDPGDTQQDTDSFSNIFSYDTQEDTLLKKTLCETDSKCEYKCFSFGLRYEPPMNIRLDWTASIDLFRSSINLDSPELTAFARFGASLIPSHIEFERTDLAGFPVDPTEPGYSRHHYHPRAVYGEHMVNYERHGFGRFRTQLSKTYLFAYAKLVSLIKRRFPLAYNPTHCVYSSLPFCVGYQQLSAYLGDVRVFRNVLNADDYTRMRKFRFPATKKGETHYWEHYIAMMVRQ